MRQGDHDNYLGGVRKRIRAAYRPKGARGPNARSPGEEFREIFLAHQKSLGKMPNDTELWLAFFDEAAAFWLTVWLFYKDRINGPEDSLQISFMTLAGRVAQDIFCVRKLIASGFFVQSNVVTRATIESIDMMHLLQQKPNLADEFRSIIANDDASKFWHQHCSRDKIGSLVKERWLWFFDGNVEVSSSFHSVRKNYLDLMGMSAHPTFAASFVAFMDSAEESDSIAKNAMGAFSNMSKFTVHLIIWRMFKYGLLWIGPEVGLYKSDNRTDDINLSDRMAKGLSALFSMVSSLDGRQASDPFFPEFRTYWPSMSFETAKSTR